MYGEQLGVVRDIYGAWRNNDVRGVLARCTDDFVFSIYLADGPEHRLYRGRCEFSSYLIAAAAAWDLVEYHATRLRYDPASSVATSNVRFCVKHSETGSVFQGNRTHEWRFRGDRVSYCGESGDTALFRAFRRMVESV